MPNTLISYFATCPLEKGMILSSHMESAVLPKLIFSSFEQQKKTSTGPDRFILFCSK